MRVHAPRWGRFVDWRTLTPTIVVVLAVAATGLIDDKRSCQRQQPIRRALRQYALDAAAARDRSALLEQTSNPAQARIDRDAAVKFRRAGDRVPVLDCGTIPAQK